MSKRKEIATYVKKKIILLSEASEAFSRAELAKIRRGVGMMPGENPDLYGFFLQDMPEEFWSQKGDITKEEWACYLAITLYSLHQQSNSTKLHNMHTDKQESLGSALRKLARIKGDDNARERLLKRLQTIITSKDMNEFSYHLKGVITLLRNDGIPLNYAEFAQDIYDFQFEESKNKVGLRWGQDYFRKEKEYENE
ncbi:MAG: type I-E CRISPR-associated protein Cse2/CasB [Acetatifactor sp.]